MSGWIFSYFKDVITFLWHISVSGWIRVKTFNWLMQHNYISSTCPVDNWTLSTYLCKVGCYFTTSNKQLHILENHILRFQPGYLSVRHGGVSVWLWQQQESTKYILIGQIDHCSFRRKESFSNWPPVTHPLTLMAIQITFQQVFSKLDFNCWCIHQVSPGPIDWPGATQKQLETT